jgi:small subunit ribosomal protein S18
MSEELQNTENQKEQENKNVLKFRYKKRVLDTRGLEIDYRKPEILQKFISKTGKILPRRMTGASAKVQRRIAKEIKRARMANLLPFTKR